MAQTCTPGDSPLERWVQKRLATMPSVAERFREYKKKYGKAVNLVAPTGYGIVLDPKIAPFHAELAENWQAIRDEALAVLPAGKPLQEILEGEKRFTTDRLYKVYFHYMWGYRANRNSERSPITASILQKYPQILNAFLAILEPTKAIPHHIGTTNAVLRYHLGLVVPEPDKCVLALASKKESLEQKSGDYTELHWQEGKSLLFEDMAWHTAWNHGTQTRMVLIIDYERELPFPMSVVNRLWLKLYGLTPMVQNARAGFDIETLPSEGGPAINQDAQKAVL